MCFVQSCARCLLNNLVVLLEQKNMRGNGNERAEQQMAASRVDELLQTFRDQVAATPLLFMFGGDSGFIRLKQTLLHKIDDALRLHEYADVLTYLRSESDRLASLFGLRDALNTLIPVLMSATGAAGGKPHRRSRTRKSRKSRKSRTPKRESRTPKRESRTPKRESRRARR